MSSSPQRVALVTGGNRGLGNKAAEKLAGLGYRVVITSRSEASGQEAAERIRKATGNAADVMQLDLASLDSVRKFAKAYQARGLPLHALINNAGVMSPDLQITRDGFELTFQSNHLGHFLLTNLLLPQLRASASARIVVVSSRMHIPADWNKPPPDFDFGNLKGEKYYNEEVFYKNTKLANMWFTYELARRLEGSGVTCNAVCPGFIPETLVANQTTAAKRALYKYVLPRLPWARSAEQGVSVYVMAATDPALEGVSGKFFLDGKEGPSSDESHDAEKAKRLWNLCAEWSRLDAEPRAA